MNWLLSVYIGATIFGAGITIIDLLGIFGHNDAHGDSGGHDDGGHDGGDHDGGDHDGSGHDTGEHDGGVHEGEPGGDHESLVGHENYGRHHKNPILKILTIARHLVYFCLGFGPVGWFALGIGNPGLASLLWSIPVGIGAMAGGSLLKRFMRKTMDSQIKDSILLMETASVLVSVNPGQMGKVRILLDGTFVERYARADDPEKSFPEGSTVYIVDIKEDHVLIDDEKK